MLPRTSPQRGGDARLARLVPWIFRNEVANFKELQALGEPAVLANVESSEGRELGAAVCNLKVGGTKNINIVGRMLSSNAYLPIDQSFFVARIQRAIQHRERFFGADLPFYRLLNAEGDDVPGVICDRFGDVLCLQFLAAGVELLLEEAVLDALETSLAPSAIVTRADPSMDRELEQAPCRPPSVARGKYSSPCVLPAEEGFVFEADLLSERWSSGRFYAERLQRTLLRRAMDALGFPGVATTSTQRPRVLSLFGESLGLVCAARGAQLTFVEGLGETQRARAETLALRNGCADQVEYLRVESAQAGVLGPEAANSYDIVTLETPPFAPTYGRLEEGLRQYSAWVAVAAAAVRPRGLLLFACRSRAVTAVQLMRCANLGIWAAKRQARLVHRSACAPIDFPIHLALPDTREMQVVAFRVV